MINRYLWCLFFSVELASESPLDGTNSDLTSIGSSWILLSKNIKEFYLEDSPYRCETDLEMRHRFFKSFGKYNYKTNIISFVTHLNAHAPICTVRERSFKLRLRWDRDIKERRINVMSYMIFVSLPPRIVESIRRFLRLVYWYLLPSISPDAVIKFLHFFRLHINHWQSSKISK